MTTVADLIRALRSRGMTQCEIERRTGIPQPRVSRWERGQAPAGSDDVLRLVRLLAEVTAEVTAEVGPAGHADTR